MLRLQNITKNYKVAGGEIEVLKGLNIAFRKNEFVSILGPSGCGKTTTLNIVGGLDKYTSGDLIISGKSTKDFTDRDWDVYRNRRIGFVFQTYNLIPHQTVLGNVELALTISGISKEERVQRAMSALEKVGLKGEEKKRPNQLSGGQCQRVAIARALVNEPDILLADEPTGALDSKTSVQIMDLIKEISKDKLVIMVTHNGEIAEQYSNRIIRLVDGEVVEDTNPYTIEQELAERENQEKEEPTDKKKVKKAKAKMSLWTAFKLSARNLFSKRGRTLLTAFAGSIGIIGISAVIAVSTGVRTFIADMQDDMLSGNPITIKETAYDISSIMDDMSFSNKIEFLKQKGYVNVDMSIKNFAKVSQVTVKNTITQDYVDYVMAMPSEYATLKIEHNLDLTNNIYTEYKRNDTFSQKLSLSAIKNVYKSVLEQTDLKSQASLISSLGQTFMQAPDDNDYIATQYNLLDGDFAKAKDEVMIVVNKDRALTDLTLAQLGYYNQEEFITMAEDLAADVDRDYKDTFTYEELLNKEFTYYYNNDVFTKNTDGVKPFSYNYDMAGSTAQGIPLKIVGILEPKDNIHFGCLTAGFYYTRDLVEHIIGIESDAQTRSDIVAFTDNPDFPNLSIMQKMQYKAGMFTLTMYNGQAIDTTITYDYEYESTGEEGKPMKTATAVVGKTDVISTLISSMMPMSQSSGTVSLTLRHLGGETVANEISIYPMDFNMKDKVVEYLDKWNEEGDVVVADQTLTKEDRGEEIKYTDSLSLIMSMVDAMIDIVTIALIAFTSLSLVVSCVMIAIITYVSVVERIKEIGVIRSLGGRKSDVSNLFNAETFMIGTASGLVGIGITYVISLIVNVIVQNAAGFSIMILPIKSALIMVGISVLLTVISGLIPARKAAHQDPVVALRTE